MDKSQQKQWLDWVLLTSIPIRRYAPDESPTEIASACLLEYQERRFVLTVSHAVKIGSRNWAFEIDTDTEKGTEVYLPSTFLYLNEVNSGTGEISEIDYCYAEIPTDVNPVWQYLTPRGPHSGKAGRHVFSERDIVEPKGSEIYAFAGQVHPELHGPHRLVTQPTVYPGLRYIKSEGPFHEFKLPVPHPGHDSFKGCSGAPIVDTSRRVVGLVVNGDIEKNTISGVSLARYRFTIDFYCKQLKSSSQTPCSKSA